MALAGTACLVIAVCPVVSRSTGRLASGAPLARIGSGRISLSVPDSASGAVRRVNTIPVQ
ncbi:MAG TPA: hypothetical protein VGD83_36625 [Streptosporangiaceae bacterium]